MTASLAVEGVTRRYGDAVALGGVDLAVEAGEYVVLLGPSGGGKTTLLSVLGGFVAPDEGRVTIGGRDVTALPPAKRPTTTVFQDYALFPHMTLAQNAAFGPRMRGAPRRERLARAQDMLALVGLSEHGAKRPSEVSGGQRQRAALARALAVDPDVLLLDEPLGALDLALRRAMQDELTAIQGRLGTTFVHVTHDQEEAMALASRLVVMRAGRIEDEGPPARVYARPATLFTAEFMGETNRIPASAGPARVETPFGPVPLAPPAPGALVLCLRPEAIRTRAGCWPMGRARVLQATFAGTHHRVRLEPEAAPGTTITAHLPPAPAPEPGAWLTLSADVADIRLFPAP